MTQNKRIQYLAAFAVSLAAMSNSVAYFWMTPMLPKFYNNETSMIRITPDEISWVVASLYLGIITGSLLTTSISDRFGRRNTLLCSAVPYIVGTVFIICASEVWLLYIGRFFWGLASGLITNVSSIYLSEIADKEFRSTWTTLIRFMSSFGALLVLSLGSFVSYQVLSYFLIALPVCYFVACWRIPETPYFLIKMGRVDAVRREMLRLSGRKDEMAIDEKLSEMRSDIRMEMFRLNSVYELLTGKQYRKAVIVTTGLLLTQIMAGSIPIQQYFGHIVQESNDDMNMSTTLIIFGLVSFTVGLSSSVMVNKVNRRPLLIYTYLGSAAVLSVIGTYIYLQRIIGIDDDSSLPISYLVFAAIICFTVISGLGFDSLASIIPLEIVPANVRTISTTVINTYAAILTFLVLIGYQILEDWLDLYGVFWVYTTMAVSGAVFTYFVVPETKDKSLKEIQIGLQGNMYHDADDSLSGEGVAEDDGHENTELKEMVYKNEDT